MSETIWPLLFGLWPVMAYGTLVSLHSKFTKWWENIEPAPAVVNFRRPISRSSISLSWMTQHFSAKTHSKKVFIIPLSDRRPDWGLFHETFIFVLRSFGRSLWNFSNTSRDLQSKFVHNLKSVIYRSIKVYGTSSRSHWWLVTPQFGARFSLAVRWRYLMYL